jgi:predicted secreted hydrolase
MPSRAPGANDERTLKNEDGWATAPPRREAGSWFFVLRSSICLALIAGLVAIVAGSPQAAFAAESDAWARITGPPVIDLPRDHGAHPEVRTEWWYLTANLRDDNGHRHGVQVTFFRSGLDPAPPKAGESPLRARQAVAAHLAVAEVAAGRFRHAERVGRADGGFSGFASDDLEVWLGDWQLERRPDDTLLARASDREAGIAVELSFQPVKGLVRQGIDGYSQKGADPGNASAYLSWTRLEVSGTLVLDGRELAVVGEGWFDHEWGSSQLGEGVAGWDWFSLRLDDRTELMVYRLRREDGSADPYSSGTLVRTDGSTRRLAADEVVLEPTGWWTSPATGGRYPSGWRITVPSESLDLEVAPLVPAAELDGRGSTGVVYWEGPVEVSGSHRGEGYAELTGYAGSLEGRF